MATTGALTAKNPVRSSVGSRVPGAANTALKVKSRKEEDKLKVVLSQQLREDMTRLLEDGPFADLSLVINSEEMPAHRHLLQSRLEPFFSSMVEPRMSSSKDGEETVADLSTLGVTAMELKYLLRAIYAEDNVSPFWVAFQEAIKSHVSDQPMECGTVLTDCNGDPTPVSEQCPDSLHLESLENALHSECQTKTDTQQPEETVQSVETNDVTIGNQTVGSSTLSVQVCQYATLQSMGPKSACEPSTTLQNSQSAMLNSGEPKGNCDPGTNAPVNHDATVELKVCEPSTTVQNSQSAMLNSGEPKCKCEPETNEPVNHGASEEPKMACDSATIEQNKHGASSQHVENKNKCKPGTTLPKTKETPGLTDHTSSLESATRPNGTVGETDKSTGEPKMQDDEGLLPTACQLGGDLLRIFQGDAGHDVTLRVDGRSIPAHRFILCARSEYFSAMLAGSWKESTSSEIEILGFSYSAVMVALQWMYGGSYELPDGVVLKDLLFLADMYGLDKLTEVIDFKLRKDYCHFFHKPCSICLARIPECFALCSSVQLSDLEKCVVSWLVQYLSRAWMERTFAALSQNLLFKCRDFAVESVSPASVTPLLLQVDKLICNLPHIKWANPVRTMALELQGTCRQYMACNFLRILGEQVFREQLRGMNWKKDVVEPVFARVLPALTPDTANATFMGVRFFHQEVTDEENGDGWNPDAVTMVTELYTHFYSYMVSNASLLTQGPGWSNLPSDLQESIKKEAVFIDSRGKVPARKPILSSSRKGKSRSVSASSQNL